MGLPFRSLVRSKQFGVIVGALVLAMIGVLGVAAERWWLVGFSVVILLLGTATLGADIHRKVGRAISEVRSRDAAQREALNRLQKGLLDDMRGRLRAIETAGHGTVSELATFRSQVLSRFDVLAKELLTNSRRLADAAGSMSSTASDMRSTVDTETSRFSRAVNRAARGIELMIDEVDQLLGARLEGLLRDSGADNERLQQVLITELDAMLQVHERLSIDGPTPLMGGWAMSPIGMKTLLDLATEPEVNTIIECGSGTSTVLMALALERDGRTGARIVSLEHLAEYAELTESQLDRLGLGGYAEIRHAPLEPIELDGGEYRWYASSAYSDLADVDLLVVDGPPRSTGPMARYPAFPLLQRCLSSRAAILLDDVRRSDERNAAARWLEDKRLIERQTQNPGQLVVDFRSD